MLVAVACAPAQSGTAANPPFTVTISALQPTVKRGHRAMIHIVLKSITQGQLTLPEDRNGGDNGETNYLIFVKTRDGKPVLDTDLGTKLKAHTAAGQHSAIIKYLNFGEEVAENADLNRAARITAPGDYVVQVQRDDGLYTPLHIKSNKIVIHLER
jgi:hypothetical protein